MIVGRVEDRHIIIPITFRLPGRMDVVVAVHSGTILWHGGERDARVFATGRRPLLGMALLDGSELKCNAWRMAWLR